MAKNKPDPELMRRLFREDLDSKLGLFLKAAREAANQGDYDTVARVMRTALSVAIQWQERALADLQTGYDPEGDAAICQHATEQVKSIQAFCDKVRDRSDAQRWRLLEMLLLSNLSRHTSQAASEGIGPRTDQHQDQTPTHSPDFTSVDWFGTRYTFTKGNQAEAVRVLWGAYGNGKHSISQERIRQEIGSSSEQGFRLAKVFRKRKASGSGYKQHPAWGTMIQQASKGTYRLVPPESP